MSHALGTPVVTETITLWLESLEGAPQPPPSSSLVESMTYVALYNVVLRRCAKLILKMRTHSLALAKHGSETDKRLAEGWSLEALMTTSASDPSTPKTSWSHYIQRIVADSQDATAPNTFDAVLLTYYKLRSVLGQMQTKQRQLGLASVKGVMSDPLADALSEHAKRLYAKTKASLGVVMDDVASDSDAEGDNRSSRREKREVSLLLRQAHAASLQDSNKAPSFGLESSPSAFSPHELALFKQGDEQAINKSLVVSAKLHNLHKLNGSEPSALTLTSKDVEMFKTGADHDISKSLKTSKAILSKTSLEKEADKENETEKEETTRPAASSVITRVSHLVPSATELVQSATSLPSEVGQALGDASVATASIATSQDGTNGMKVEDVVSSATALPSEVGQAVGDAGMHVATQSKSSKSNPTKKHKVSKSRTLQKSKAHRRKHKVKPSKRRGNRSSSWGVL